MAFGVTTDVFGFAGAKTRCVSSGLAPEASSAQAEDSFGDIIHETVFGHDTVFTREYIVGDDTSWDSTVKLGSVHGGKQIHSIVGTRNNKDELRMAVTGSPQGDTAADIAQYLIPWPTGYCAGGVGAKMAGLATVAAGRIISSSINAAVTVVKGEDSKGNIVCKYNHGGRVDATNEVQSHDTTPAVTYDTAAGWAKAPGSGQITQGNKDYETGTFSAFKNIVRS